MPESQPIAKKGFSIDWLVKGTLTKIGDIFDRLTGRGWKPSSSLATSELIERMKSMMDAEVRVNDDERKYVPHNIKLKMQWDKFSTDSEQALLKLENEFLVAAVDHINDKHYFTHAPLSIEVKPDYFTSGVKLYVSFDKLESEEAELEVTLDGLENSAVNTPNAVVYNRSARLKVSFTAGGKPVSREIELVEGQRLSVGRTKENDIAIDDQSVSKAHASLLVNRAGKLIVADTGSTNGTFVRGERIAYGKAVEVARTDSLAFGLIKVDLRFDVSSSEKGSPEARAESYKVGEFEFSSKTQPNPSDSARSELSETVAAIAVNPEMAAPISKTSANTVSNSEVAPQPAVSETKVDINKEKQDWEV